MKRTQVVGIGNALVDVIAHIDDAFLADERRREGHHAADRHRPRRRALRPHGTRARGLRRLRGQHHRRASPRSAARTAYVGKVKDDQLGAIFAHDLRAQGARLRDAAGAAPTTRTRPAAAWCWSRPDGERSMNTYLGVSEFLAPADIDEAAMAAAEWIFLEGYRYDGPDSIAAFEKAVRRHQARRRQGRRSPSPIPSASSATATSSCG